MPATVFTGKGIEAFRWTTMKHAVLMESKGFRVRRGRKVTPQAKAELGLKRSAKVEDIVAAIDAKLAALTPELTPDEIRSV